MWFPPYLANLPKSAALITEWPGIRDDHFWLTIHPLAILSLIAALALNWKLRQRRNLVAVTMATYAVTIAVTSVYFVPELIAFGHSTSSAISAAEWYARGQKWQHLSWIRGAFCFAAFVPLLLAWRREVH